LVTKLESIAGFTTVAVNQPLRTDTARMPAAYVFLNRDMVFRKTGLQENHNLLVTVSILRVVATNANGDIELSGLQDGIALVGTCCDALTADRTLGGAVKDLKLIDINYGKALSGTDMVFWGDIQAELKTKPISADIAEDGPLINEVYATILF
jgi:hypothetical protein